MIREKKGSKHYLFSTSLIYLEQCSLMFLALLHANAGHRRIEERLCTSRTDLQGSFRHDNVLNATQNRNIKIQNQ
jgi:hypothetical protein